MTAPRDPQSLIALDQLGSEARTAGQVAELVAIQVPPVDGMTEGQRRGHFCVWCCAALRLNTSVDLGERKGEDGHKWFPRGCPRCTAIEVHNQFLDHLGMCEQCADERSRCSASASLRRALREGRRL